MGRRPGDRQRHRAVRDRSALLAHRQQPDDRRSRSSTAWCSTDAADQHGQPALAVSWTNIDPLTWQVKLREGVTFHDGTPFTAEDVIFSLKRAEDIPNSPAPFAGSRGDRTA